MMVEIADSERNCTRCGGAIDPIAGRCVSCGLSTAERAKPARSGDPGAEAGAAAEPTAVEDPELVAVDPEHRVQVAHFDLDQGEQAELACGMLRANGIACELSNPLLPGLPNERALWVNAAEAGQAAALLAQAESRTEGETDNAA